MSFLVAFNGQFSPHFSKVEGLASGVPAVKATEPSQVVSEFKNILHEFDDGSGQLSHPQLKAYQKQAHSFQQQKKREHARDIMTTPVKVISQNASVKEAKAILEKFGFRHLPVVNEMSTIVGMISDRELIGAQDNNHCHEIMIHKVLVCEEHTSINEIAIILLKERLNALPIINRTFGS